MAEDAACNNPCGGEPLMCRSCSEIMGESYPPERDDFEYEDRGGYPCEACDSPCEVCVLDECLQGPDPYYRPDYKHMKETLTDEEWGECITDFHNACIDCGYDTVCADKDVKCPHFRRGEP